MTINTGKAERDLESIGLGHNATASLSPVTTRHEYKGWIYRFRPTHNITSPSGEVMIGNSFTILPSSIITVSSGL